MKKATVAFHRWSAKEKLDFNDGVGFQSPSLDKRVSISTQCKGTKTFMLIPLVCALSFRMGASMGAHLPSSLIWPKLAKDVAS